MRSSRAVLFAGVLALAAPDARAAGVFVESPILMDGKPGDDDLARSGALDLQMGERRVLMTRVLDEAYAVPSGAVDVARLGTRTVVLTPRRAGCADLRLGAEGDAWTIPLIVHPQVFSAAHDAEPWALLPPPAEPADSYGIGARHVGAGLVIAASSHASSNASSGASSSVSSRASSSVSSRASSGASSGASNEATPVTTAGPRAASLAVELTPQNDAALAAAVTVVSALPAAAEPARSIEEADGAAPKLSGILRTSQGAVAILDGHPTAVGERASGYKVERVENERVVLSQGNRWLELALPGH